MTAPALVALAQGIPDRRSAATIAELTSQVRSARPDLVVETAYLDQHSPSLPTVVNRLVRKGVEEVVVVPLILNETAQATSDVNAAIELAQVAHQDLPIRSTKILGLETALLEVLDTRLRAALSDARVRELDGLVLAGAGSADPLANQAIARLARVWAAHHKLPVTAAYASQAPPATGEAVRAMRAQGRRHVAVGSLFLAPGPLFSRATELALEAGAVAVSQPLGAHQRVAEIVVARYLVGALELVPV